MHKLGTRRALKGQNQIKGNSMWERPVWYRLFLICCLIGVVVGCGEQGPDQLMAKAETAAADSTKSDEAEALYTQFLVRFPKNERAPEACKKQAIILQQQGKMRQAIDAYNRLWKDYPASEYGAEAHFMIAFIYEEYLQEYDQARDFYQRVIDRYPDSELAASAKRLLPHVGRAPEEWVQFQDSSAP